MVLKGKRCFFIGILFGFVVSGAEAQELDFTQFECLPPRAREVVEDYFLHLPDPKTLVESMCAESIFRQNNSYASMGEEVHHLEKKVIVERPLEEVWDKFVHVSPSASWRGPIVNFVASYSPKLKGYSYVGGAEAPPFHEGQIIFNYLNILGPRLVVALKVANLDEAKHRVELAYLQENKSIGTQILQFTPIRGGKATLLVHLSFFRSDSKLRDAILYPIFHSLTAGEFYRNSKKRVYAE